MSASKSSRLSRLPFLRQPEIHKGRFPYMDTLRAGAALSVVLSHFNGWVHLPDGLNFLQPMMIRLGNGVLVFFVISGFLIYRPFVKANLAGERLPGFVSYGKRRFLRIVPAYVLALTVTAAFVGKSEVFGSDGFLYYGFAQIYSPGNQQGGLSVAWSLCIEATLYLFLPIWAWFVAQIPAKSAANRVRREFGSLVALLATGVLLRLILTGESGPLTTVSLFGYLDLFAIGMLLAFLSVRLEGRPLPRSLSWLDQYPGVSWAAGVLCFMVLAWGTGSKTSSLEAATVAEAWSRHILATAMGVFLILPIIFGDQRKGALRRALGFPPFLWLGVISYGIYLFHPVVLHTLSGRGLALPGSTNILSYGLILIAELLAVVVVAAISWHFIERPINALKRVPLLSPDRAVLPQASRIALAIAAVLMVAVGITGTGYVFIDAVLAVAGGALFAAVLVPVGRPRPAIGLLLAVGVIALVFAAVPALLRVSTASTPLTSNVASRAFIAGTSSKGTLRLYVNGKLVAKGQGPRAASGLRHPIMIGSLGGNRGWVGAVDAVSIYNRPITQNELIAQYRAGLGTQAGGLGIVVGDTPGLVGWFPLGDVATGARDAVTGVQGRNVGQVAQSSARIAPGDGDGGSVALKGFGTIVTPPIEGLSASEMSVGAWVQTGASVSNRVIVGSVGDWALKTDLSGHWFFGANGDDGRYGVSGKAAAKRYVGPTDAASRARAGRISVPWLGLLGALLAIGGAIAGFESIRGRIGRLGSRQRPAAGLEK